MGTDIDTPWAGDCVVVRLSDSRRSAGVPGIPLYGRLLNTVFIATEGIEKGHALIKYGRIVAIARVAPI